MSEPSMPVPDNILFLCLSRLQSGEWTIEECRERYPEHWEELAPLLEIAGTLSQARELRPSAAFRERSVARLQARIATSSRPPVPATPPVPAPAPSRPSIFDRLQLSWPRFASMRLAFALVCTIIFLGATVFAVDAALPGDPLYNLKLTIEAGQLSLATSPAASTRMRLAFADRRLQEAERLAADADYDNLQVALFGYAVQVSMLAELNETAPGDEVDAELNQTLALQANRLDAISLEAGVDPAARRNVCQQEERDRLPIAMTLAEQYHVEYSTLLEWYCNGHSFGEITVALATAPEYNLPVSRLLELKGNLETWTEVWAAVDSMADEVIAQGGLPSDPTATPTRRPTRRPATPTLPPFSESGPSLPEPTLGPSPTAPNIFITPTPPISVSPTRTPSTTPSPTASNTPWPLPTATATLSPTNTATPPPPSDTPLPLPTATFTPTATATITPTNTAVPPTATPTETITPTATVPPTSTPTPSVTPTPSPVPPTPTPSSTPVPTDTPPPTATPSPMPTATYTPVPTDTPMPTATATRRRPGNPPTRPWP